MTNKVRGFELIKGMEGQIPERASKYSAGYDFYASEDITVPSLLIAFQELNENLEHYFALFAKMDIEEIDDIISDGLEYLSKTNDENDYEQMVELVNVLLKAAEKYDESIGATDDEENVKSTIEDSTKQLLSNLKPVLVSTGVKSYMPENEFLQLSNRSSGPKNGLVLANGIGVIDSDYYNNESNEGHIMFQFYNLTPNDKYIKKGDKIGQGIFMRYYLVDNDDTTGFRTGGFGSSGK